MSSSSDSEYAYPSSEDDDDTDMKSSSGSTSSSSSSSSMTTALEGPGYILLDSQSLKHRLETITNELASLLCINHDEALVLLRNNIPPWNTHQIQDHWFTDPNALRKSVGLPLTTEMTILGKRNRSSSLMCPICYDNLSTSEDSNTIASEDSNTMDYVHLACDHNFCSNCFTTYLTTELAGGATECSALKCPDAKCTLRLLSTTIQHNCSIQYYEKFQTAMLRSFVDMNRTSKWCPNQGCDVAAELTSGVGQVEIFCSCGFAYCFNCPNEAHKPASCIQQNLW